MINWIKKLFRKKGSWTILNRNGQKTIISPKVMDYFNSELPNPSPRDLRELISKTKKLLYQKGVLRIL